MQARIALSLLLGLALSSCQATRDGRKNDGLASAAVAASPDSCVKIEAVDYADYDGTVDRLGRLFQSGEFAPLDGALACLMLPTARFKSGKMGAIAVYWMFRQQFPAPEADPAHIHLVRKWQQDQPLSIFAEFAGIRLMYAMAWNARGYSYAQDVPDGGFERFHLGLRETERALLGASTQLKNTPIWQNLLLAVAQDGQGLLTNPDAVFEEGVRKWPQYHDFYEVRLTRLVPKWGGSWDRVDQFIVHWSAERQSTEGDSLYARLYASVMLAGAELQDVRMNWLRMKPSLEDWVSRYPEATNKNVAASIACRIGDRDYFRNAMERIGKEEMDPTAWVKWVRPEVCLQVFGDRANGSTTQH